jgi:hypothetical protein
MKVVYGDAPIEDKLAMAAAQFLQISFVAPDELLVQTSSDTSEIAAFFYDTLWVAPEIQQIWGWDVFEGKMVTVPRYVVQLGTGDAITIKKKLQATAARQNMLIEYNNRQTCTNTLYVFPDPEVNNTVSASGQRRLSDDARNAVGIAPWASSKDVDSSMEVMSISRGILQAKWVPAADVEFVMFDGGALAGGELSVVKQWNHVAGTSVVTSDPHGETVSNDAVAISNAQRWSGTAPGTNINIAQIGWGWVMYTNKLYDAQDSLYLRMLWNPNRVFVPNRSFYLWNDAVAHSKVTTTTALTIVWGGARVQYFKAAWNSGPNTIDPCASWSELIMCGGWVADLPDAPTAALVSTGVGMDFSAGVAEWW